MRRSTPPCALVALLVVLAFPAVSHAGCGGTEISHPARHPRGQPPPLAIGDSTMLLSLPGLAHNGFEADAHGCREFFQGLDLLAQLKARRALPHMVVVALGANGDVTGSDVGRALGLLGPHRLLVLVTPRELGGGSGADAATERAEARRHPGRILLLDWVKYSGGHGNWFDPDGLHLLPAGVDAFTALIARVVPYAYVPCPLPARKHRAHPAAAPGAPPITLHASDKQTGYIAATIDGPPGVGVQLGEVIGGQTTALGAPVLIPASGQATVRQAATWLCTRRSRSLVAMTVPPAAPATAQTTIMTPSCANRLLATISRHARVGGSITVRLKDRWRLGGLTITICLAPPGAGTSCRHRSLSTGEAERVVKLATPRPGGWNLRLATRYGQRIRRTVWATHPGGRIRLLLDGDSEMQILDTFIGQDLGSHGVGTTSEARISTGLTTPLFNWQAEARRQARAVRPDVSVVFIGANDGFGTRGPGGATESCCGPAWSKGYANLVAEMMRTLLRRTAGRVYWFLLPTPRPANFQSLFDGVNRGIKEAAARFPGRVGLIDANAFFTPGNRYRDFMTYHGSGFTIHEADGIHLSTASDRVAASLLLSRLKKDRVIR
jgi:lysophospholipase L1-like esterase